MKTRDAVIEYQKTLNDSGTLIKDITLVDPVSALYLEFEGTNGATSNEDNFLSDVITKIEITDGSEVLYALSLSQLEALSFYKTKRTPVIWPSEWASGGQRHGVYLLFGRYLWDPTYNMDFRRYTNPQLKITSNIAAIRAAGATGFVSGSLKATIIAKVMEDVPSGPSYLMAREIEAFTSASSGERRVDLPIDLTYRLIMLQLWSEGYDIDEIVSDIKLTADTDKFVFFNRKVKQLDAEALQEFGMAELKHDVLRAHNTDIRTLVNKEGNSIIFPGGQDDGLFIVARWQWSSQLHVTLRDSTGALESTAKKLHVAERGHALHATLPIPFGLMDVPATWFDPRPYKKIEAVLTQATADAVCSVVVEQVR